MALGFKEGGGAVNFICVASDSLNRFQWAIRVLKGVDLCVCTLSVLSENIDKNVLFENNCA